MELVISILLLMALANSISIILIVKTNNITQQRFTDLQDQFIKQLSQDNKFYKLINSHNQTIDNSLERMNSILDQEQDTQGDEHEQR